MLRNLITLIFPGFTIMDVPIMKETITVRKCIHIYLVYSLSYSFVCHSFKTTSYNRTIVNCGKNVLVRKLQLTKLSDTKNVFIFTWYKIYISTADNYTSHRKCKDNIHVLIHITQVHLTNISNVQILNPNKTL